MINYLDIYKKDTSIIKPSEFSPSDYVNLAREAMQLHSQSLNLNKGWKQIPNASAKRSPKSWFFDPLTLQYSLGYKDRRFSLTYEVLKRVVAQLSILNGIINLRSSQVASFSQPYRLTRSLGFIIRHKDPDHKTTNAEMAMIKDLENFISNCGRAEPNPYSRKKRDDFEDFLRKIVRDTLTFDQVGFEIIPDKLGIPYEWYAVDASTLRIASDDRYVGINSSYHERTGFVPSVPSRFAGLYEGREYGKGDFITADGKPVAYVQVVNGQIENIYSEDELAWGVRNPRTDIYIQEYGYSEVEQLITIITAHLNAETYNRNFFSQGSMPKGILNLKGDNWTEDQLEAFKRYWTSQMMGAENAFRTPVLQSEGLEWVDFEKNNRDMEFGNWLEYLLKVSCFPAGEHVVMGDGSLKDISLITPGETVRSHTGKERKVVNVQKSTFTGDLINIRSGGEVLRCTPDHPFYVSRSVRDNCDRIREFEEPEWRKAKDISERTDYLIVPKKTYSSRDSSCTYIDLLNYVDAEVSDDGKRIKRIKGKSNSSKWAKRFIPLNKNTAYALGLYVSAGSSTGKAIYYTFSSEEKDLVREIEAFGDFLGAYVGTYKSKETTCNARITNSTLATAFSNIFGSKAQNKVVPKEILTSSKEVQRSFISGLVAGDSSVPIFNGGSICVTFSSISEKLVNQLIHLLLMQDVYPRRYRNISNTGFRSKQKSHRIDIYGDQAYKVSEWLGGVKGDKLRERIKNSSDQELKSAIYETDSYFLVPVTEIWTEYFDGFVYNMEVDKDHTYQVERFSVHNCAVFLVDPAELNFDMKGGVQQTPLFESSQEWKLKASRDRGLKPLLKFIAKLINKNIIDKIDDHFALEFVGLDEMSEQDKHNMLTEQLSSYMTLNEVRRQLDLPDLPGGDIPMNPTYIEVLKMEQEQQMNEQQMQLQQDQMDQGGEEEGGMDNMLPGSDPSMELEDPQYADNYNLPNMDEEGTQ